MILDYTKIIKPNLTRSRNSLILLTNIRSDQLLSIIARNANFRPKTNTRRGRVIDNIKFFKDINKQRPKSKDNDTRDKEQVGGNRAQAKEDKYKSN